MKTYICAVRLAIEAEDKDDVVRQLHKLLEDKRQRNQGGIGPLINWQFDDWGGPKKASGLQLAVIEAATLVPQIKNRSVGME